MTLISEVAEVDHAVLWCKITFIGSDEIEPNLADKIKRETDNQ